MTRNENDEIKQAADYYQPKDCPDEDQYLVVRELAIIAGNLEEIKDVLREILMFKRFGE